MMQHVHFVIFLAVWIALVAGIVAAIERVLEAHGYRTSVPLGHDPRSLPIEAEE
jgi:hypothetical protein